MKYRRLSISELKELEKEFIDFLASNTITAEDWQILKSNYPEKSESLLDIFSDIVYDKILSKMVYLQRFNPLEVVLYKCGLKDLQSIIITTSNAGIKLDNEAFLMEVLGNKENFGNLSIYRAQKEILGDRKQEIFQILQQGSTPCSGIIFEEINRNIKS